MAHSRRERRWCRTTYPSSKTLSEGAGFRYRWFRVGMQTMLHVPNMVKELSESGGWGTLEGDRERRRVGSAAKVEKRQRREQAQRRNDSKEKNWQNRYPCSAVPAMNGRNE